MEGMISTFKVSSVLLLLATFIWHIKTETLLTTDSDAEEEEETRLNILHGNESFRSTLPPETVSSSRTLTDDFLEPNKKEIAWWENEPNSTDYVELNDEKKTDASPENSVDRDVLENVNDFLPDELVMDTSVFSDSKREQSSRAKSFLLIDESHISASPGQNDKTTFLRSTCSFGDRKCTASSTAVSSIEVKSKLQNDLIRPTLSSSPTASLMDFAKSLNPEADVIVEVPNTSVSAKSVADYVSVTPTPSDNSTTAQTSDNLILVEGFESGKDESVINIQLNKSEKSRQITKQRDSLSESADEILARTFVKTTELTPMAIPEKESFSSWNTPPFPSTILTKLLSSQLTTVIDNPVHIKSIQPTTTSYIPWKTNTYIFPHSPVFEKEPAIEESTDLKMSHEFYHPFSNISPTYSWQISKPVESEEKVSRDGNILETISVRASSFSSFPNFSGTGTLEGLESSFSTVPQNPSSTLILSPSKPAEVTPVLKSLSIQKVDDKGATNREDRKQEAIPPPRLSNPGCSSLPVCVEVTLLETTWEQFCTQKQEFLEFLSKSVSHYTRPIHAYHIVLDTEVCALSSALRQHQTSPDIAVAFYVTNDSGEYEERMTEICGVILRKWAPSTFKTSVIEVRLYNSESLSTALPVIPELNSGFVAAVSISAVAGVALCLLCIMLVVMKQKLIQGRNSDTTTPTADAYSLDSLSISASFRRRRNRRSARSYLNHAFNDQEIPSHPLNEKTLSNCVKSKDLLEEEYRRIPMTMPKLDSIPEGAHAKNRYSNILPKSESRVMLADPSGDPLKCYINANYVKGYGGKSASYIAGQAPLPEGIEDFWRMVWEQQSRVIIMLTMFEENGTSRCAVYFPQSTLISQQPFGDFQISLLKKDVYEFYTLSTLRLLDLEKNLFRDIAHLWFTGWPDVGVPKDPSSLVTFVQQSRPFINCNSGPTIVHCSTGTGRTGVFLALDICMREYEESRSVDILQCVSQLRRDRSGAVQNKDQYFLIHEAMLEYVSRMINQSQRPSICS